MSFSFLRDAVASTNWGLAAMYGLEAAAFALACWSLQSPLAKPVAIPPTPSTRRAKTPVAPKSTRSRDALAGKESSRLQRKLFEVAQEPFSGGFRNPRKVKFATGPDQVRTFEPYNEPHDYQGDYLVSTGSIVAFKPEVGLAIVSRWIESDGEKLNFPRTKWISGIQEDQVDDDGDISMVD
ncbi:MAG: hypothetical protein M1827_004327 [Pycnora praestabilis]|nr:MAG: hypothetical protein M1827_004327 [Pycnora praestabilis]